MESTAKMEDNFQEYSNVPVHVRVMRRFALGFRELILLAVVAIVVMMCIIFVIMFGVSKSGEIAARAQAQKGVLFDNTCFTRGCLDTISYTIDNMNFSVNPCDNFYEYACGNYKKRRPLDADNRDHRPLRDVFLKNREKLRALIERPVKRNTEWASERKLKHLFQSCMDDFTLEKLKGKPFLDQVLVPMGGWYVLGNWDTSQWDLNEALKKVQTDFWVDALWAPRVGTDWNDWQKRSIEIHPAGTGRYMRWFYYTDPASAKIRKDYKKFMRRVASLIVRDSGVSVDSQTLTNRVNQFITDAFSMETHIARIAMTTDRTQSPYADTSKISLVDLKTKTGNLIDWPAQMKYLFDNAGVTDNTKVAVFNFNYLSHIADVINNITQEERARAVHNYLTWRLVEGYVQDLSTDYSHANREVYVDITGYREFRGRWNYCFYYGTVMMKEAVGSLFVADHFAEQNKQKVTDITANMKQALQNMLRQTSWIDEETRTYAESKIKSTNFKLGYPDFLVNQDEVDTLYNQLQINGSDYMGNVLRLNRYSKTQWNRELREGEDRSRWFYRPFDTGIAVLWYWNQIVVPAGILQFPFYDLEMPHYYSFGSFGSILAHFMIHVVDEWGSRWDKDGELMKDESGWWTNATRSAYTDVKQCVIDAYINKTQGPVVGPSGDTEYLPLNPAFVATEALTITSGIRLSYQAYQLWQSQKGREQAAPSGRGLTNEQLFFVASAQTYCFNTDNDILYWRFRRGSFVAGNTRVNMAVSQLDEFSQSFRCSPTSKMSPPNKCTVY